MGTISPKLTKNEQSQGVILYPYYAGYSYNFVKNAIESYAKPNSLILDPWAGTGLTNRVAMEQGISSIGLDINPVMTVISKAGLLDSSCLLSIEALTKEIEKKFISKKKFFPR